MLFYQERTCLGLQILDIWVHTLSDRGYLNVHQTWPDAANALFGKIGRFASEEVVLKIIHSKRVPILLYGLEAFPLNKADLNSLDFVINRFHIKLFKTSNLDIVRYWLEQFCFELPSVILARRRIKLEAKF